ncbi:MAG TPA: sialidase family protein, partial [Agriterribacter sp.]|nr:sialidase family protein [Agriterribacter sp.]
MFIRADGGVQQLSYSKDRGETWSHIQASNITSPLSPASIGKLPETGDLVLVWNNNVGIDSTLKNKRAPLTIAISKDEGRTWGKIKNIENDP